MLLLVIFKTFFNYFFNKFNKGDAIYWNSKAPELNNNYYLENNATYGGDVISNPYKIAFKIVSLANGKDVYNSFTNSESFNFTNVAVGYTIPYKIMFYIVDTEG